MDNFGETHFGKGETITQYVGNTMNHAYSLGFMNGLAIANGLERVVNGHYVEGLLEIVAYTALLTKIQGFYKREIPDDLKKYQTIDCEV